MPGGWLVDKTEKNTLIYINVIFIRANSRD